MKGLDENLFEVLTTNTHLLPDAFTKHYEDINLNIDVKGPQNESPLDKRQSSNSIPKPQDHKEIFTPRDGSTINLLLNQIDASQFNWRKKDLALIQNFIFKCFLSLNESLYRASILIELFIQKVNDVEIDQELEYFFERFFNKMSEYRKGFLLKRKDNHIESDQGLLNGYEVNNEFNFDSKSPLPIQNSADYFNYNDNYSNLPLPNEKKKQKGFLLALQESSAINNSVNVSQNKGLPNANVLNQNNINTINGTLKNIEVLNELELYIPLGISELLEIFLTFFPDKEFESIGIEWANSIKKDKTTSHFHGKESLAKYLSQIKIIYEKEDPKTQALKTLEDLIILKEEALEIQMEKIKNMMELYGDFVTIFNKKLYERGIRKLSFHKRLHSKENASEFVKKTLKDKCISLINRKLDVDLKEDQINEIKEKAENQKKLEAKNRESNLNMDLEDIKKNIDILCSHSQFRVITEKEVSTKSNNKGLTKMMSSTIGSNFVQQNNDLKPIKSSLKKTNSLKIKNQLNSQAYEEEVAHLLVFFFKDFLFFRIQLISKEGTSD